MTPNGHPNSVEALKELSKPDPQQRPLWAKPPREMSEKAKRTVAVLGVLRAYAQAVFEFECGGGLTDATSLMQWLGTVPDVGLTDREIMRRLEQSDPNWVRPRITEGKRPVAQGGPGLIVETGKAVCEETGHRVRTTRITWRGLAWLEEVAKGRGSS